MMQRVVLCCDMLYYDATRDRPGTSEGSAAQYTARNRIGAAPQSLRAAHAIGSGAAVTQYSTALQLTITGLHAGATVVAVAWTVRKGFVRRDRAGGGCAAGEPGHSFIHARC